MGPDYPIVFLLALALAALPFYWRASSDR